MRILQLVPGSGGTFYCQNCLRDRAMVRALRRAGHDVVMVPLYLPMFGEEDSVGGETPIFFGGVNIYLRERFPIFRKAPRWLDSFLDARWILRQAATREGSTSAVDLGPMTLSMLKGSLGNQRKEFDRFLSWLSEQERPDVIHISNALLLGFAPEIRKTVDSPIVCSLQDEEGWVDAMRRPFNARCWEAIAENAKTVSAFVSTSAWYADRMVARMKLDPERVSVVHPGVDMDDTPHTEPRLDPPTIGFLARLNPAQGLERLVDAFLTLRHDSRFKKLRLSATGGYTPADRGFLEGIHQKIDKAGAGDAVEFLKNFQMTRRGGFLNSLSVLSVPAPEGEAFGIHLLEAMAHGVPVVQPAVGAYPEIVEATGGGILYDPKDPKGLILALESLLGNPEELKRLGEQGRRSVLEKYNMDRAVREMLSVYETVLDRKPS